MVKFRPLFLFVALVLITMTSTAQQGTLKVGWGWNRSWYSNSDVTITTPVGSFVLEDVAATDRQSPFEFGLYFNPTTITIPQTNYGASYFITDDLELTFYVDHMKYVMVQDQAVRVSGDYNTTGKNASELLLTEEVLTLEHTDGLNYINAGLTKYLALTGVSVFNVKALVGADLGAMLPKTNASLFGMERSDRFHLSGYGLSTKAGLNVVIAKYFYLQTEVKAGFIHMPDVQVSFDERYSAAQMFSFLQTNFSFGFNINLTNP